MLNPARFMEVRFTAAALLLLLAYATSLAMRTGLADMYAYPAKSYLQDKRDADEVLSRGEWQAIHESLDRALVLEPGNPANLSALGRLHRILLEADDIDAEQILHEGDAAAAYYQAALNRRPTWPWDWGNLAKVKYQQFQDTSRVYQDALVRTVEFGPREPSLQRRVAEMGSDSWANLNPAATAAVLTAADRALERNSESVSAMSGEPERWRPVCAQADESYRFLKRRCDQLQLT